MTDITAVEKAKQRFQEAVTTKGRVVTIKHVNPIVGDGFDPILGSYREPQQHVTYTVDVVPMSSTGEKQFAERMEGRFIIDPAYSAYSFGAGEYTPFVGDVILFDGVAVTIVAVDTSVVDNVTVHYQVGIKRG